MFVVAPFSSTYESILEPILSVVSVSLKLVTVPGAHSLPFQTSASPLLGTTEDVSTSCNASILVLLILVVTRASV